MYKTIIYIFLILRSAILHGQQDSTWQTSLTLYHTKDLDILNQNPLNYTIGLLQVAKGNHTMVGYLANKSNYDISGLQYGMDYYKKGDKGYYHFGLKKSSAIFYPTLSLEVNLYRTVSKGLELGIGHRYLTYANANHSHATKASAMLYTGHWMLSYRLTYLDLSKLYHYGAARFWLSDNDMYIEANLANADETIVLRAYDELLVSSLSYGIKVGLPMNKRYHFFAAFSITSTTHQKENRSIGTYAGGVKIDIQ